MPTPNQPVLDFLLTRRSRPAKTLTVPAPNRDELMTILTAAARTPDHGKLEPWRFLVLEGDALTRIGNAVAKRGQDMGLDSDAITKARDQFLNAPLVIVVVASPVDSAKVPFVEQTYSAGAVCLAMVNAALASGWGANWLSGWAAHDRDFCFHSLNLRSEERVAGFIHIGTETNAPPERPRPDLDTKIKWIDT